MEKNTLTSTRPFGMRDKLCYACGDIGNDLTFVLISSFMLKFYTDIMGVDAWLVGALMMAARFVDAVTDIGMGTIVDMTDPSKSRFGKFRVWMLRGCVPVLIFGFLVFGGFLKDAAMPIKIAWMFVTYIIWGSVFYTMVNIPYGSMASAVTDDPNQRTELSAYRSIGGNVANLIVSAVGPLVVYVTNAEGNSVMSSERMMAFSAICAVLGLVFYLMCIFGSVDRVYLPSLKKEKKATKKSDKNIVTILLTDRAFLLLMIATVLMIMILGAGGTLGQYVYPNYYGNTTAQSVASLIGLSAMIVIAVFSTAISKRFGKRELGLFAMATSAAIYFLAFLLRPASAWVYGAFQVLIYMALGAFSAVSYAMIIDVIDNTEVMTGRRDDGKYYGVYSFSRKVGQAFCSMIAGGLLTLIGYTEATAYDTVVVNGIYNVATLFPAIGLAISAVALYFYPLKKNVVDSNTEELRRRREGK